MIRSGDGKAGANEPYHFDAHDNLQDSYFVYNLPLVMVPCAGWTASAERIQLEINVLVGNTMSFLAERN